MKRLNKEIQDMGRERYWSSLRYYPVIFLHGLRKTMKKLGQDYCHTGHISKQEPIKQVTNLTTSFSLLGTNVWSFLDIINSYFRAQLTGQTET
jgi:hypothetical protein